MPMDPAGHASYLPTLWVERFNNRLTICPQIFGSERAILFTRCAMSATAAQWNQIIQYEDGQFVLTGDETDNPDVTSDSHRKPPKLASNNDQRHDEKPVEVLAQ